MVGLSLCELAGLAEAPPVCHHNTLLIYGSLAVPTLDNWNKVAHASTGVSVVASLVMGASGYMIFVCLQSLRLARS